VKAAIRQRALDLGFDACGFASAEAPATAGKFKSWITDGRHGEMHYLERNAFKRVEPDRVLEDVRTVIALAASYDHPGFSPTAHRGATGEVARYARFADYHDILGERLATLASFVNHEGGPDAKSLWYVDTGPILERDLAQRAGIGFIGKHTNLISRQLGNWIFLGEILTTLELQPDVEERNRCGTCTRCIAACPTEAITGPFELDARRCISYLTIELKGSIPLQLRRAVGRRIYGCDDCLAVCPWNRFAREGRLMREQHRPDLEQPDLLDLLSLDDAGFKARFRATPIWRTKRRGLLRNVCVALGNIGDAGALPALDKAAADPEPLIAEHAKWAIGEIRNRVDCGKEPGE
jgi:epoxyqueuosine reductase